MLSQAAGIKSVEDLEMFRLIPSFILGIIKQDAERRAKKTSNRWQRVQFPEFSQGLSLFTNMLHMVRCIFDWLTSTAFYSPGQLFSYVIGL